MTTNTNNVVTVSIIEKAVSACVAVACSGVDVGDCWIGNAVHISWDVDVDWDVYINISIRESGRGAHDAVYRWVCQHHEQRHGDCYGVYQGVDSYSVVI